MKSLLEYILNTRIIKMALDRNAFKRKIDNYIIQIIENYALVYYCHHINKECKTLSHWENELCSQIKNAIDFKIKVINRKKSNKRNYN